MKLTAPDLMQLGVIDAIIQEPEGGAQRDAAAQIAMIDRALSAELHALRGMSGRELAAQRREKFRRMGAPRPEADA